MNERLELDDSLIDRLVDGELAEQEYCELLSTLESRPDGWRRCALAFLEAQMWRRDLRELRNECEPRRVELPAPRQQWSWKYSGLLSLTSAASFLLAFLTAAVLFQPGSSSQPIAPGVAQNPDPGRTVEQVVKSSPRALAASDSSGELRFMLSTDDGQRPIELPVFPVDDPRASMLLDEHATQPVELIRALQQMGYAVERRRQWAPLGPDRDKAVLVPIEELQITPVSARSYQ